MRPQDIDARLRLLPPIRRARLWRLYAQDGRRFLDLWQDGGRGILGARGRGLGVAMKAALDRGLDRPLPSHLETRLARALRSLWPRAKAVRLFIDEGRALAALARACGLEALQGQGLLDSPLVADPARMAEEGERPARLLRPFAAWLPSLPETDIVLPLLGVARGLGPTAILFADEDQAAAAGPGDLIPPLLLSAAIGAIAALAAYEAAAGESTWARMDKRASALFDRRGPWLFPRLQGGDYDRLFEAALGAGILIAPDPGLPSIVPGDFDDGEIAPLSSLGSAGV